MGEAKRRAARGELPKNEGGRVDRDAAVRKIASDIDERVKQLRLANSSIADHQLIEQMAGFLPGLHQLWTTTSDETLARLCRDYPAFHHYAQVMEDAFEARRQNPNAFHNETSGMDVLPANIRSDVALLMTEAATLERELQNRVNEAQHLATLGGHVNPAALQATIQRMSAVAALHQKWVAGLSRLADKIQAAKVAPASAKLLEDAFGVMNQRIGTLNERLFELVLAGRAAAADGAKGPTQ